MEAIIPTLLTAAGDVFGWAGKSGSHIRELPENLESLKEEMEMLIRRSEDLEQRVQLAKQGKMIPNSEVEGWLDRVGKEKSEVLAIQKKGAAMLEQKFPGRLWNVRPRYKLGKRVSQMIVLYLKVKN